jgi:hypothetical protein
MFCTRTLLTTPFPTALRCCSSPLKASGLSGCRFLTWDDDQRAGSPPGSDLSGRVIRWWSSLRSSTTGYRLAFLRNGRRGKFLGRRFDGPGFQSSNRLGAAFLGLAAQAGIGRAVGPAGESSWTRRIRGVSDSVFDAGGIRACSRWSRSVATTTTGTERLPLSHLGEVPAGRPQAGMLRLLSAQASAS